MITELDKLCLLLLAYPIRRHFVCDGIAMQMVCFDLAGIVGKPGVGSRQILKGGGPAECLARIRTYLHII